MSSEIQLRIRYPDGVSSVNSFPESSTVSDLKQQILSVVKVKPEQLVLRAGYPPTPLNHPDHSSLSDAQISSGDTLIVEIHQDEELPVEQKPNISENVQNQSKPNVTSDVRTQTKIPVASNQPAHNIPKPYATEEILFDSDEENPYAMQYRSQQASDQIQQSMQRINPQLSNQRNPKNLNQDLMGSDMQSYRNKISSASNTNYKNGSSASANAATERKTPHVEAQKHAGDMHGATNLSKGRNKEFASVSRKPGFNQDNPHVVDLTSEHVHICDNLNEFVHLD